jgi:hypothetical protein
LLCRLWIASLALAMTVIEHGSFSNYLMRATSDIPRKPLLVQRIRKHFFTQRSLD